MASTRGKLNLEDLTNVTGGAKSIFVAPKTIWNWLSKGTLTRYKVGGRTLVSKKELLSLIQREG